MKSRVLSIFCIVVLAGCGGIGGKPLNDDQLLIAQQALLGVWGVSQSQGLPNGQIRDIETISGSVNLPGAVLDYRMTISTSKNSGKVRLVFTADCDETYSVPVDILYGNNTIAKSCTVSFSGKMKTEMTVKNSANTLSATSGASFKIYNPNAGGARLTVKDGSETIFDQKVTFRFTSSYKADSDIVVGIKSDEDYTTKINGETLSDGGLIADINIWSNFDLM